MIDQKDRKFFMISDKEKEFSKSVHTWLAQYDEEDDFLSEKVANTISDFTDEE